MTAIGQTLSSGPLASENDAQFPGVELHDVTIERGGVHVVTDAMIRVVTGSVVGLVGPNGSGKSSLLKAVHRSLRPLFGTVSVGGADVWRDLSPKTLARRLALVGQDQAIEFDYTVQEVVQAGRLPYQGVFRSRAG